MLAAARNSGVNSASGNPDPALNGDLALSDFFVNVARDFRGGSSFPTLYVGFGAGVAVHEWDLESVSGRSGLPKRSPVIPAFQLLAGVPLEAEEDTDIVVGYRYLNYYGPDYTEFSYDFVDFHNFEIGFKFYPEDW